jgi:methyl-accepting chemotaxis protein
MQNAADYIRQYMEEVFGGSSMSLAEKFGDALIDAFKSGADAAVAFGDTVSDVMRNMVRQLVYQKVILPYIEEMMSKYVDELEKARNRAFRNGEKFNATDWWLEQLDRIAEDYTSFGEQLQERLGNLDPKTLDYLYGKESTSASSRGIAQASQDSIDELNGRMTMIQEHTAMLSSNMVTLVGNTNGILLSVKNIDQNVAAMEGRMNSMASDITNMRIDINFMRTHGIEAN